MKKITILLGMLAFALPQLLFSLDASLSYATFKSPDNNYIEIYLHIAGKTVNFNAVEDSLVQAQVEVITVFKQGEKVIKYDKYVLNSPTSKYPLDFIDLKRYSLENGEYQLIVLVNDQNHENNKREYSTKIRIDYQADALEQSDIQLLASFNKDDSNSPFTKNGLHLEPLPFNFYGKNASSLIFYNEVYQSDQFIGEDFLVSYSIEKMENQEASTVMIGHKRQKAAPIIPLLIQMDISELASGNYNLKVDVRDRARQLLSQRVVFFQRSNPYLNKPLTMEDETVIEEEFVQKLNEAQLDYSLRALVPKVSPSDVELIDAILKNKKVDAQRLYLFNHWANHTPTNPEFAYQKYMEVVAALDEQFNSGFRHGFETDRGYIYLKYGQPDDIQGDENDPSAPPYEVWSYNDFPMTKQTNVRFIFYNPSLAPNDFQLLHSNAIGELNDPQWQRKLYKNDPNAFPGVDDNNAIDNFGRRAARIFNDY